MNRSSVLLLLVLPAIFCSCREKMPESIVMTVMGPVPAAEMGQSLVHEHVLVDWIGADSTGYHRWDRDSVILRALPYLMEIKQLGVRTFADCTPAYLGRDPFILRELSSRTGLNIITNTGYYGAVDNRFIPAHALEETAGELAGRWIDEYERGIDDSGVRPGFIKIGVREEGPLSELHRKLVKAAAITHKQTGLTIKSHTGGDVPAFEQIEILRQEGVAPSAFIWTHAQAGTLEKQVIAAKDGAWISLDGVNISSSSGGEGTGNMEWYVGRLNDLKKAGVLNRVIISHDAGWYDAGEPGGGGYRGYGDIHSHLVPALIASGFTGEEIERLISGNPAAAFAIETRIAE
jgi:phosphotriesterase-related protein